MPRTLAGYPDKKGNLKGGDGRDLGWAIIGTSKRFRLPESLAYIAPWAESVILRGKRGALAVGLSYGTGMALVFERVEGYGRAIAKDDRKAWHDLMDEADRFAEHRLQQEAEEAEQEPEDNPPRSTTFGKLPIGSLFRTLPGGAIYKKLTANRYQLANDPRGGSEHEALGTTVYPFRVRANPPMRTGAYPAIRSEGAVLDKVIRDLSALRTQVGQGYHQNPPSTATLRRLPKVGEEEAKAIRDAILKAAVSREGVDAALDLANEIMGGFGVESIRDNEWDRDYYADIGLLYVNMGDTYETTLIYDTRKDKWIVSSWGDIVERHPKRFEE